MTASMNIIVSIINLFSLLMGGISVGLIFKLSRNKHSAFLNYYFFFLLWAVISGFCDWIIFNWIFLLVPDMSTDTADWIYHIFWDLIGFPAALFALYFLIKTLNALMKFQISKLSNLIIIFLITLFTLASFTSIYFRLREIPSIIGSIVWSTFFYILPIIQLLYLAFVYFRSSQPDFKKSSVSKFVLLLFFGFAFWHFLSLVPINFGILRHLIILSYFLILLVPAVYLYINHSEGFAITNPETQNYSNFDKFSTEFGFTDRENEILVLLSKGKSNKEISEELFISLQTAKNYISKIYKKIGVKNRLELINLIQKSPIDLQ